nr:hypothetical protein [Mycolicibacterium goodii]
MLLHGCGVRFMRLSQGLVKVIRLVKVAEDLGGQRSARKLICSVLGGCGSTARKFRSATQQGRIYKHRVPL